MYRKEARLFSKFRKLGVDARIYTDGHLLPEVLNKKYSIIREKSYKKKLAQLTEFRQFNNTILKNEE
uniref:hypothetical protein n=1 Tax=Catenibacterium mitsuokai TaxID=100886 RepID=UPI003FEE6C8D